LKQEKKNTFFSAMKCVLVTLCVSGEATGDAKGVVAKF